MKDFLASKKTKALLTGIVSVVVSTYFVEDPAKAESIAQLVSGLVGTYLLGQGAADAFGTDYHKKKK